MKKTRQFKVENVEGNRNIDGAAVNGQMDRCLMISQWCCRWDIDSQPEDSILRSIQSDLGVRGVREQPITPATNKSNPVGYSEVRLLTVKCTFRW